MSNDDQDKVAVESDATVDNNDAQETDHTSKSEQMVSSFKVYENDVDEIKIKGRRAVRTRSHDTITETSGIKSLVQF